jgi:hypothetical protein
MDRKLTPEQEEEVERQLAESLAENMDDIAAELGIHPQWRDGFGEWTAEEAARIIEESDRQSRDGVIEYVLMLTSDQPPD